MYLLSFEEWISAVFVKSLGWTFTHSLWQALLALLVAYTTLAIMRKAQPALRYNMLLIISLLFIVSVIGTFVFQLNQHSIVSAEEISNKNLQDIFYDSNNAAVPVILQSKIIFDGLGRYFNSYLHLFVAAWFIIFCVKWLRLTLSLNYVNRISRYASTPVNHEWQTTLTELKNKIGVGGPVKLLQSNIVKVPLVSGFIKPMILVPAGMLSNMPHDLIESILLHELAHIRRRDYLVNILQSAIETIFFFNPFIIKLSTLVREEREACCDEIAVDATKNKVTYVEALVAFGELSTDTTPALSFAGSKNHLLQRVKRILYNQNKKPGIMEKSILLCSVITMFVITAFTSVNNDKKPEKPILQKAQSILIDTVPGEVREAEVVEKTEKRKKKVREAEAKMEKKQKELEEMQIDLQLNQMHQGLQKTIELQQEKVQQLMTELDYQKHIDINKINKEMQLMLESKHDEFNKIMNEKMGEQVKVQQLLIDSITKNLDVNLNVNTQLRLNEEVSGLLVVSEILNFLESNNVADAKDIKSFRLNEDELIVNGKKQPSSLHLKLKEKYPGKKGDYVNYSNSGGNKSISIQHNDPDSD